MEGEVMTSSPGNLSCKKIIHAVGPKWVNGERHEEITLLNCVDNCFLETEKEKMQSIAIPPISTGIFEFPMGKAVKAIVGAIKQREKNNEYLPQLISLVDNKSDSLQLFETELRQSKARPSNSSSSSATGKYTITDKMIKLASGISIELVYDDLMTSQEDTLVNSVGKDMNLSSGKVAAALSKKAGPQLQAACTALAPIASGEVKETDGFNLACKKVLHCNCPRWQGPQTIPLLKQIMMNCLNKAASNGYVSIAFPALGTGNLNYPPAMSAQYMIEAIMEFSQENPESSITQVKVIVYHLDIKTKKGFENEMTRLKTGNLVKMRPQPKVEDEMTRLKTGHSPKINLQPKVMGFDSADHEETSLEGMSSGLRKGALKGCVAVHNTKVRIVRGDITDHKAEALVLNSTDGGLSIREAPKGLWVSGAGHLTAKFIFHIKTNNSSDSWSKIICTCLEECDKRELQSIAFPALGTGELLEFRRGIIL
ncbi:PARP14 [Bugula neritina]|uniref:PARP14 n=1 Tax=Bugula neritina TaxID=10212 RepID=A0A7J7K8L5_BUGNE|nr:PARP14 [Bugula neritina]